MKKTIAIILVLVLALGIFAGCGSTPASGDNPGSTGSASFKGKDINNEEINIAYVGTTGQGELQLMLFEAAEYLNVAYPNVNVTFFDPALDLTKQIQMINDAITQKFDCIFLEALDSTGVNSAIEEAEAAGIPVITFCAGATAVHTLHFGTGSYDMGRTAAVNIVEKLGGKGNIALIDYPYEVLESAPFCKGFEDYIADYPDIKVIDHQYLNRDTYSQEGVFTITSDILTKYDRVDAFYTPGDDLALGIIQAIDAAGKSDDGILVWGNEFMSCAVEPIREGKLFGTCWSDRFSLHYASLVVALALIENGTCAGKLGYDHTPEMNLPATAVTKDNVEKILVLSRWTDILGIEPKF